MSSWSSTARRVARAAVAASGAARDALPDPSQTPTHPGLGRPSYHGRRQAESRLRRGSRAAAAAYFAGERAPLEDVPVDLEYETSVPRRVARAALRAMPRGEVVTYGELAALAGAPGAARAAGSFCARNRLGIFVPCHRVVAAGGLGSYGSLRRSPTSGACSRSRATPVLSDDLREELAAIAPDRECDRLAELSGLFHVAGRAHLRGRGSVDVHLDVSSSTVARRAFALLRAFGVTSEIRTYRRSAFDRATRYQLHVEGSDDALRDAAPGRRARPLAPAARPAAAPRRRPPLLRRRLPARRAARLGNAQRPARPAPRDPHCRGRRARASSPTRRGAPRRRAPRPGARARTRPPTRRERRRSPTSSSRPAPSISCSRSRSRRCSLRRAPTRTASRTPTTRTSCARAGPRTRSSRRSTASTSTRFPTICARSRSSACAIRPPRRRSSPAAASPALEGARLPATPPFAGAFAES